MQPFHAPCPEPGPPTTLALDTCQILQDLEKLSISVGGLKKKFAKIVHCGELRFPNKVEEGAIRKNGLQRFVPTSVAMVRPVRGSSWHQRRPTSLHDLSSALTRTTGARRFIEVELSPTYQRRSRISKPAAIASTASTVLTVVETRTFSNGKSPVRINQTASKIIPKFLPARVLVIANLLPPL